MNIAVISANGRAGTAFVKQALKAGHKVRAGVYGNHNFVPISNLQIVGCDATSLSDIKKLIASQDAVVSLIGHTKNAPKDVQTKAITNLVGAVSGSNIRIVSLTGTGVRFDGDKPSLNDKFLNFGIKSVDPNRINDGINHVEVLKNSQTNWTIIRVLKLSNTKPKKFSLKSGGPAKLLTSRAEVAEAILQVLGSDKYIKQAPIISTFKK